MKKLLLVLLFTASACFQGYATLADDISAKISSQTKIISKDDWYGGRRIKFDFEGLTAWVVVPSANAKEGNPWTWTMQWADAFIPRTAVPELIAKGWFHVTLEAHDYRATDEFLPTFARFQKFLVEKLGLAPKACLIGMSWGGFYSTRYAAAYPENVKAVYLDAPLMNFDGDFSRKRNIGPWESCPPASGSWTDDPRMPVNKAEAIAKAGIPVLLLYGTQDSVVNPELNCEIFISKFKEAGGRIEVIPRKMWNHHPHGLDPGYTDKIQALFEGRDSDVAVSAAAPSYLPAWQPGYFDIHCISTKKGDATFMVYPDGTTLLLDTGDMTGVRRYPWIVSGIPDESRTPAQWVVSYIRHFFPELKKIDYMSVSHFHSDHMGTKTALHPGKNGYQVCGISEVGESIPFGKIVDRGYPDYDFPSVEKVEKACGSMAEYKKFVAFQTSSGTSSAEKFEVGSHKQFSSLNNPKGYDFDAWNVAGNCTVAPAKGKKVRPMYKEGEDPLKFDENMFSTAILFRYGRFKYFNGGDIGGWSRPDVSYDRNYEEPVADLIGPCDVVKANHHASRDVMNPYFLWTVRPDVILLPCTATNHPQPETLDRMHDYQYPGKRLLFPTSDSGKEINGEARWSWMQPWGHVVVRVYPGGGSYQIYVLDVMSRDYRVKYSTEIFNTPEK